jgi:hypothetical protein
MERNATQFDLTAPKRALSRTARAKPLADGWFEFHFAGI